MKKNKTIYWIFTILFAAFMAYTAVPNVLLSSGTKQFMTQLGYPDYFTVFIGVAKLLGCIGILVPGYPRIKEWAYAGLFFDLVGATFSVAMTFGVSLQMSFMLLPFILGIVSYIYFSKCYRIRSRFTYA